jgi:hypothetical protein
MPGGGRRVTPPAGRRSGKPRTAPVLYLAHSERLTVIGSNAAADRDGTGGTMALRVSVMTRVKPSELGAASAGRLKASLDGPSKTITVEPIQVPAPARRLPLPDPGRRPDAPREPDPPREPAR